MSTDIPSFPDEKILSLMGAIITVGFCTNPARAIDNDPATAATFTQRGTWTPRITATFIIQGNNSHWIDTGIVIQNGEMLLMTHPDDTFINFGGGSTWFPEGNSSYVGLPGFPVANTWGLGLGAAVRPDGSGPPVGVIHDGLALDPTIYVPQANPTRDYTIATGGRLWLIVNDDSHADNSGYWTIRIEVGPYDTESRYLRAEWGDPRFISRVRLRMSGLGAGNAAITFDSGFDPEGEVPVPYIPLPSDENSGTPVDEVILSPPLLARAVTFFPDHLAESYTETGEVSLYQFQIYESANGLGDENMAGPNTQTVSNRVRVGFQEFHIFPWITGKTLNTYDALTGSHLAGLKSLDVSEATTSVTVTGGETIHPIATFEVTREGKYKATVAKSSLKTLYILQGGRYTKIDANANGGEVQYLAPNLGDDAPYFFALTKSKRGEGVDVFVFAKCKITGAVNYNMSMDQVTNLEFEFTPVWDETFVCQDGNVGGIIEKLWAADGNPTLHS